MTEDAANAINNFMAALNESNDTVEYYKFTVNGKDIIIPVTERIANYVKEVFKYGFGLTPEVVNVKGDHEPIPLSVFQGSSAFDDLINGIDWKVDPEELKELALDFVKYRFNDAVKHYGIVPSLIVEVSAERLQDYSKKSVDKEEQHYSDGEPNKGRNTELSRELAQQKLIGKAKINTTK